MSVDNCSHVVNSALVVGGFAALQPRLPDTDGALESSGKQMPGDFALGESIRAALSLAGFFFLAASRRIRLHPRSLAPTPRD